MNMGHMNLVTIGKATITQFRVTAELPGPRGCTEAWRGLTCHSQAALYLHFHKWTKRTEDIHVPVGD